MMDDPHDAMMLPCTVRPRAYQGTSPRGVAGNAVRCRGAWRSGLNFVNADPVDRPLVALGGLLQHAGRASVSAQSASHAWTPI